MAACENPSDTLKRWLVEMPDTPNNLALLVAFAEAHPQACIYLLAEFGDKQMIQYLAGARDMRRALATKSREP